MKVNLKIEITKEPDGTILLNGFSPKSSIGKGLKIALHVAMEEAYHEKERKLWLAAKAKAHYNELSDLLNTLAE